MSNEQKHTAEPWNIVGGGKNQLTMIVRPGDEIVSHVARMHDEWLCDEHGGTAFDNARRIVACVNACAGLSDPVASIELLKADHRRALSAECQRERLTRENQVLREALQAISGAWGDHGSECSNAMADAMAGKARAALASTGAP